MIRELIHDVRIVAAQLNGRFNPQYRPLELVEDPDELGYQLVNPCRDMLTARDWAAFDRQRQRWQYPLDNDPEG